MIIAEKFIKNISLDIFWGGFGNHIQQIALAIMYSDKYNKNFFLHDHQYVGDIENCKTSNIYRKFYPTFRGRFFYYGSEQSEDYGTDYPINVNDFKYYTENFHKVIKERIKPKINFIENINLDEDLLVVHIRNLEGHPDYVSNPISYYKFLFEKYEKILVVTDNEKMPIINKLKKLKKFEIQSTTLENDFNTLMSASNLATSGVGTFSISAAMMSDNLINFYYSNYYLDRHLNPKMLNDKINKYEIKLINYFGYGHWNKKIEILEKYLYSDVEIKS